MTSRLQERIEQKVSFYQQNFPAYAQDNLKIRTKTGAVVPFKLNKAQLYAHELLEKQKRETGKVRAIIVKARQQGFSTYIAGRFYHKTTYYKGIRTFILAHEMEASDNLFSMAKRYHEYMIPPLKPSTGISNAKELSFDRIESGYKVSTAGNKATGRSQTIQLFHGSEVAFWPNDREHAAGILQAVPNEPGTEVIFESTGNGMGNLFYEMAMQAQKGQGQYQLIFIPWFMTDEYRVVGADIEFTEEENEYAQAYNLNMEQVAWRRQKIEELGEHRFKQEYPANVQEAFQASGEDSYIPSELIMQARNRVHAAFGDVILGVDPSGEGSDRTVFVWRQGPKMLEYEIVDGDEMHIAGRVVEELRKGVRCANIDAIGIGSGIVARLKELKYGNQVNKVIASNKADDPELYLNKRAECWGRMKDWLADASIPNDDDLHMDLSLLRWQYDSNGRVKLESKRDLRKDGRPSPDIGDALSFTFAYNISAQQDVQIIKEDLWR
jgi:hypothetical protein